MLDEDIKIVDELVKNISYEHERDSWQRIKAALAESTNSSHNSVRDAICAFSGQCQYQNNGTAKTCKLPEYIHGCSHRQHP